MLKLIYTTEYNRQVAQSRASIWRTPSQTKNLVEFSLYDLNSGGARIWKWECTVRRESIYVGLKNVNKISKV